MPRPTLIIDDIRYGCLPILGYLVAWGRYVRIRPTAESHSPGRRRVLVYILGAACRSVCTCASAVMSMYVSTAVLPRNAASFIAGCMIVVSLGLGKRISTCFSIKRRCPRYMAIP